ncbi:hypothetical protein FNV43_RR07236 [Rhamnella rubrinervis]|uniref:Uncharacterized protein n=1 Tax=Rhamnella rubrinervis TaxID=2594499 RepID=A0A8K0MMS2_9ROSA|nr:hypothetical protein FNV43_RR07236 [Rhamnella rubrinervis]
MELLNWCIDNGNFNPRGVEDVSVKDLKEKLSALQKAREDVKKDAKHHFDTLVAELQSDGERDESAGPSDHNQKAPETATSSPSMKKDTRFLHTSEKLVKEIAGTNEIVEELQKWCKDYESHLPRDKVTRFLNISVMCLVDKEAEILKILMELLNWCIDNGNFNPRGVEDDSSDGELDESAGPSDHNQNAPETATSSPSMEKDTRFLDATENLVHEIADTNEILKTLQK